ncbi:MAG TPA: FtsX-like permease family protein [Dinghuibacter sp.]|uniref:FtsX-like permease family protein n=1 Tax=Dinghuibacter sp. TaxID=2024697 RepID=UPI002BE79A9F|nr:FtsX-like permease family protein [Dinghuibacter sp.]HTJ13624.1 FtsX-like permease family protein [Dinghuibacter sp.]
MLLNNYIRVAWRNMSRNKMSAVINIVGLAVGLAVALLIGLWIADELGFNHWHRNHRRIAQAMDTQVFNGSSTTGDQVAIPLKNELETKYGRYFRSLALTTGQNPVLLSIGTKQVSETGMFVEPAFAPMFTLRMTEGSAEALKDPSAILISGSAARALFGDADPMGKTVSLDGMADLAVAGVYEDLPQNTTLSPVKFLGAFDKFLQIAHMENVRQNWGNHSFGLYALLDDPAELNRLNALVRDVPGQHIEGSHETVLFHPMDRWRLYSEFTGGRESGGRIRFVWMFGLIGLFVLLLACINFMNLSTARSERRAREVGIRKAIGSHRRQLIGQFLCESLLMSALAAVLAILLAQLALPVFNELSDKKTYIPVESPGFWALAVGFTLCAGLVAGSYPAFFLSAMRPIRILKGVYKTGRSAALPRQILVVLQFTTSVALILGTLVVFQQIQYAKDRPVGYGRQGLLSVTLYDQNAYRGFEALRNDLLQTGAATAVAESSSPATHIWNNYGDLDWTGKDPALSAMFGMIAVTHDFGRTMGWAVRQGRDFSRAFPTDTGAFIVNEAAVRLMGLKHPVGETVQWEGKQHTIVGVVKDLVMESPYEPVKPTVFFLQYNSWLGFLTIRITPTLPAATAISRMETVFKHYEPGAPFDYQFVDAGYAQKFSDEQRVGNLSGIFAGLAIFISCLGLFGLASFVAEQRTKEIGIRKVLGASVPDLWRMLSESFLRLVFLALLIAAPVAFFVMRQWLQHYTYRTTISGWLFAAVGAGVCLLTLATVSAQAFRAATANPVKSLRTE